MAGGLLNFQYYYYDPSLGAGVTFIILFALSSILHVFQLSRSRTWYFIPFVVGGIFEVIGYIGRVISAQQAPNFTLNAYIVQSLLILLAPALFAASVYMILGRLIKLVHGEEYSVISLSWLTPIFVTGDVISFFAQGAGGGLLATAKTQASVNSGNYVIVGGLGIQIFFFMTFIVTTGVFHHRFAKNSGNKVQTPARSPQVRYLFVLYTASTLILLRNIVRIIEYIQGFDGYMQRHEVFIYVFDALPMFLLMLSFNIRHPSAIINNRIKEKNTQDGIEMPSQHISA